MLRKVKMTIIYTLLRDLREEDKLFYFLTFIFMKYIFSLLVALAIVGTASAASVDPCTAPDACKPGGPARGFNFTTGQVEMIPQCFPWVYLGEYYKGNIFDMYKNQEACRAKRAVDFHL